MATVTRRRQADTKPAAPTAKASNKQSGSTKVKIFLFIIWLVGLVAILNYTQVLPWSTILLYLREAAPTSKRIFTKEELSKYNGRDPSLPLLLSLRGRVYDVTAGKQHYGPGTGYNFFTGRDATQSFLTGCFNDECFATQPKGVTGLSESDLQQIDEWLAFYDKTYKYVGELPDWDK